jgi:hypothetical protein
MQPYGDWLRLDQGKITGKGDNLRFITTFRPGSEVHSDFSPLATGESTPG